MNTINHTGLLKTGRPKGARNRFGNDLKEMLVSSLMQVGGRRYLVRLAEEQPNAYVKLLCMILPKEVSHSGVVTGVSVQINTNLGMRGRKKMLGNVPINQMEDRLLAGDFEVKDVVYEEG